MPLTPQQEAEAIQIELEIRSRTKAEEEKAVTPATDPKAELKKAWDDGDVVDRLKLLFQKGGFGKKFTQNAAEVVRAPVNMAIEAGGPAAGQVVGGTTGPFAPVMVPILGGVGGMISDAAVQIKEGEPFSTGRMLGAGVSGAVPGAPLARAGARQVIREGVKYAAGNIAAKVVESEVDRGELPNVGETAIAAGAGMVAAPIAKVFSKAAGATADEALYSARNRIFDELRKEGAVVPPHEFGKDTGFLTGVAGRADVQEQAVKRNQFVWQKLAREDVGLGKQALPISIAELEAVRAKYAKPYEELQRVSDDARRELQEKLTALAKESDPHQAMAAMEDPATKQTLETLERLSSADPNALKEARFKAQRAYDAFKAGNPLAYDEWVKQRDIAEGIDNAIQEVAPTIGNGTLAAQLKEARKKIAQTYSIQNALNPATGLVDPVDLGKQLDRGAPLTGNLKKIAEFQMAFNREAIEAGRAASPGSGSGAAMGALQQGARGSPQGVLASATGAVAGRPARALLLSEMVQDAMLTPAERQNFAAAYARFLAESHPDSRKQEESRLVDTRR